MKTNKKPDELVIMGVAAVVLSCVAMACGLGLGFVLWVGWGS